MIKKLSILSLFLSIILLLSACGFEFVGHVASGPVVSRDFEVGSFTGIDIGGSRDIIYRQSDNFLVVIEQQESLFDYQEVYVDGDILRVYLQGAVGNVGTQVVTIYAPTLASVSISGSATATNWDDISHGSFSLSASGSSQVSLRLDVGQLNVQSSGSSGITLSGSAEHAEITRGGSGRVLAFDMQMQNAAVQTSGSSRVEISVADNLELTTSGSSRVYYSGDPALSILSSSGSSAIIRHD